MFKRWQFWSCAFVITGLTAAMLSSAYAAKRPVASATCSVDIAHVFRAQDGTVLGTETYQRDFVVEEGADFVDDYGTPTRFKRFTASLQRNGNDLIVSINWFADVSVFDAVDLSTELLLDDNKPRSTSASHTFSSSSGHNTTSHTLTGIRD
jgi:hypothetical protein